LLDTKRIGFCDSVTSLDSPVWLSIRGRWNPVVVQDGSALCPAATRPSAGLPSMHVSGGASQPAHRCPELDWIYWFCAAGRQASLLCMHDATSVGEAVETCWRVGREAVSCVVLPSSSLLEILLLSIQLQQSSSAELPAVVQPPQGGLGARERRIESVEKEGLASSSPASIFALGRQGSKATRREADRTANLKPRIY
jgi:hypothetical protein